MKNNPEEINIEEVVTETYKFDPQSEHAYRNEVSAQHFIYLDRMIDKEGNVIDTDSSITELIFGQEWSNHVCLSFTDFASVRFLADWLNKFVDAAEQRHSEARKNLPEDWNPGKSSWIGI